MAKKVTKVETKVENKKVTKAVEAKVENKKVMKAVETKASPDFAGMRKLFNSILVKAKGTVSLVENQHGAIQIKRDGDLLFSARSDGRLIITHPMYEGTGKAKKQVFKHQGSGYDYLSAVPFSEVTTKMLEERLSDPKTVREHHDVVYKGREDQSGFLKKAANMKNRMVAIKADTGKKKTEKNLKKAVAQKAQKPSSKAIRAIKKVAAKA